MRSDRRVFGLKDLMQPGTLSAGVIPIITAIAMAGVEHRNKHGVEIVREQRLERRNHE